jgi:hypothetical protein
MDKPLAGKVAVVAGATRGAAGAASPSGWTTRSWWVSLPYPGWGHMRRERRTDPLAPFAARERRKMSDWIVLMLAAAIAARAPRKGAR